MKALIYARISSETQKDNTSIESQLAFGRKYANEKGYTIVEEGHDIISGKFIMARSTFNHFLDVLEKRQANVIICDIPDRLGRGDAIPICEHLAGQKGGRIEYATNGYDESTIEGMVQKAADTLVSGIERMKIRERTIKGKNATARSGRIIASSYRPYGYEFDKHFDKKTGVKLHCELIPFPEEREIAYQMYNWLVEDGLTTRAIAKRLTAMGVLTVGDKDPKLNKKRRGATGEWHHDTVEGILRSPVYKGEWHYRKTEVIRRDTPDGIKTKVMRRKPNDIIVVPVPAIVDVDTWNLAQIKLNSRKGRPKRFDYLLTGRLRCGKCGRLMSGVSRVYKENHNWRYRCNGKYDFGINSPSACRSKRNVEGPPLEHLVWARLVSLLLDEEALFGKAAAHGEESAEKRRMLENQIAALDAANNKEQAGLGRLLDLFVSGEISKLDYLDKRGQVEKSIERRKGDIASFKQQLIEYEPISQDIQQQYRRLRDAIIRRLDGATIAQKQELLEVLRVECVYFDDTEQVSMAGLFGEYVFDLCKNDDNEGGNGAGGENGIIKSKDVHVA